MLRYVAEAEASDRSLSGNFVGVLMDVRSFLCMAPPSGSLVPRAELQAASWASQLFPAAKAVKSDASYVVNGIARLAEFEP